MLIKIGIFIKLTLNYGIFKRNAGTKCFPHHVKEAKECKTYFKKINIVNKIMKQIFTNDLFLLLFFISIFAKRILKI